MKAKVLIAAAAGVTFATSVAVAQNNPADYSAPADANPNEAATDAQGNLPAEQTTTGAAAGYERAGERG